MEINSQEIAVIETTIDRREAELRELNELELAMTGGGHGDISLG